MVSKVIMLLLSIEVVSVDASDAIQRRLAAMRHARVSGSSAAPAPNALVQHLAGGGLAAASDSALVQQMQGAAPARA